MSLSPTQLILKRCRAFVEGDFGYLWDVHHPESFFRRLYPDREGYLEYARSALQADFRIRECRILQEQTGDDLARVIYYLAIDFKGERRESFELAVLRREGEEWSYFATQKLERHEFAGAPEEIGWDDFDQVEGKVIF